VHYPSFPTRRSSDLVLHLCGNARQWIVSGVGGAPDVRDRAHEFAQRGQIDRGALMARLEETLGDVDATLADLEREVALTGTDARSEEHTSELQSLAY